MGAAVDSAAVASSNVGSTAVGSSTVGSTALDPGDEGVDRRGAQLGQGHADAGDWDFQEGQALVLVKADDGHLRRDGDAGFTQRREHPEELVDAADAARCRQRAGSQHLPGGIPAAFLGGGRVPDGYFQAKRGAAAAGCAYPAMHGVDVARPVNKPDAAVAEAGHVVDEQPHGPCLVHDNVIAAVGTAPVHVNMRDLVHAGVRPGLAQRGGQQQAVGAALLHQVAVGA